MKLTKTDSEIFSIWQSNLPRLVSTLNLKKSQSGEKERLIIIPSLQIETSNKNASNYLNFLLADTISKCLIKNESFYTVVWGFNSYSSSIEINAIVDTNIEYSKFNIDRDLDNISEEIGHKSNNYFLQFEKQWWSVLNQSGILFPNQMLYYTNDRTVIEIVWYLISKLWKRHRVVLEPQIDLFWKSEGIYLQNEEIKFNQVEFNHRKLNNYINCNQNLFVEKVKSQNLICSFKIKGTSAGQLSASILTETIKSIEGQVKIHENLISQLIHLKDLGYISKSEKKLDLFINSKEDNLFTIANLKRPKWANWEVDEQVVLKIEGIKAEIETIEDNISILEQIHHILEHEADIRALSWFTKPYHVPAVSALGVNPDEDYALYYLEDRGQLVIVSEKQAILTLSLTLDDEKRPGPELEMLLENEIDGGEYFASLGLPIHKLVSLKGEDLIGLEFEPIFDQNLENKGNRVNPYNFTIIPIETLAVNVGTGIYPIKPAFNNLDLKIAKDYDLPVLNTLDEKGNFNLSNKLLSFSDPDLYDYIIDTIFEKKCLFVSYESRNNKIFIKNYDEKLLAEYNKLLEKNLNLPKVITDEDDEIDNLKKTIVNYQEELIKKSYNNYTTKVINPITQNLADISLTAVKNAGIPLPLWKSKDGYSIYVENIEQLIEKSLNPIFTLINSRKLIPDNYANQSVVILGDRNTKLPLGLTAIFYKSNTLSELRKLKQVNYVEFANSGVKLLEEIFQIFKKHSTVQVLLEPHEQEMLTIWLAGYSPRSEIIEERFYFYNALTTIEVKNEKDEYDLPDNVIITQDFGAGNTKIKKHYYLPSQEYKQLKLQKPFIDEIILEDPTGKLYKREDFVISNSFLNALLMDGDIWQELIYDPHSLKSFLSYNLDESIGKITDTPKIKLPNLYSQNDNLLVNIANQNSYLPYKIDTTKANSTQIFPNINTKVKFYNYDLDIHNLNKLINKMGSDAIRFYLLLNLNEESVDFSSKKIEIANDATTSNVNSLIKYVTSLLNKFPRNNPPLTKNKYKHLANKWLQNYTQNYCLQLQVYLQDGDFSEAVKYYQSYLNNISGWYLRICQHLDLSLQPEITDCLCESLLWFSVYSFPLQPFTCEKIYQILPIKNWVEDTCFSHPYIYFQEPNINQIEVLDLMHSVKELISLVEKLRRGNKIKLKQPLYCDISKLNCPDQTIELILKIANLQSLNSPFTNTTSEILENSLGRIKIDLTIYEDLAATAFGWEIERSLIEFLKRNNYNRDSNLIFQFKIINCDNDDLVYKAFNSTNWTKLNIEVRWDKNLDVNDDGYIIEIKDLARIFIIEVVEKSENFTQNNRLNGKNKK